MELPAAFAAGRAFLQYSRIVSSSSATRELNGFTVTWPENALRSILGNADLHVQLDCWNAGDYEEVSGNMVFYMRPR